MMRANPTERKGSEPAEDLWSRSDYVDAVATAAHSVVEEAWFESTNRAIGVIDHTETAEERWNGEPSPVQVRAVVARTPRGGRD